MTIWKQLVIAIFSLLAGAGITRWNSNEALEDIAVQMDVMNSRLEEMNTSIAVRKKELEALFEAKIENEKDHKEFERRIRELESDMRVVKAMRAGGVR